jgi:hypothetical protein
MKPSAELLCHWIKPMAMELRGLKKCLSLMKWVDEKDIAKVGNKHKCQH